MPSYAVVIVGMPARIAGQVVPELRSRFPTAHVVLSDKAPAWREPYAIYDGPGIHRAVETCAAAVFGSCARPLSFCRNPSRQCVISAEKKRHKDCGRLGNQACGLKKPDHLIVLHQQSKNDASLLKELSFAAISKIIPSTCYGRAERTIEAAHGLILEAKEKLKAIDQHIKRYGKCPVLMPILNFNKPLIVKFLSRVTREQDTDGIVEEFERQHWDGQTHAYIREGGIKFCPAAPNVWHGGRGAENAATKALSAEYRLGCSYDPGFHYDVSSVRNQHLSGVPFQCASRGSFRCVAADRYVNVYPDDYVRRRPA
jgi:hypothetical protein